MVVPSSGRGLLNADQCRRVRLAAADIHPRLDRNDHFSTWRGRPQVGMHCSARGMVKHATTHKCFNVYSTQRHVTSKLHQRVWLAETECRVSIGILHRDAKHVLTTEERKNGRRHLPAIIARKQTLYTCTSVIFVLIYFLVLVSFQKTC